MCVTSYNAVVSIARKLHKAQNLTPELNDEHPWMVQTALGGLWRLTRKELAVRYNNSCFEVRHRAVPDVTNIIGMSSVVPLEGAAYVLIAEGAKLCWQRFATAKELMHVYTGSYLHAGLGIATILGEAIKSRKNLPTSPGDPLDAETFCQLIALELMIPWKYREQIVDAKRKNHQLDYDIAVKLMIPQKMVAYFFDNDYESLSFAANQEIDDLG